MNIAEMKEQVGEEEESVSEDQIVLSQKQVQEYQKVMFQKEVIINPELHTSLIAQKIGITLKQAKKYS